MRPVGMALAGIGVGIALVAVFVAWSAMAQPEPAVAAAPAASVVSAPAPAPAPLPVVPAVESEPVPLPVVPPVADVPAPVAAVQEAPAAQQAPPIVIAWVNLSAIFQEGHQPPVQVVETKLAELKALAEEETRQLAEIETRLRELEERINPLPVDSALRRDLERQYEEASLDYELKSTIAERRLATERARMQVDIYSRAEQAVRTVSERDGIHIVLRFDDLSMERDVGASEQLLQRIQIRQLMYCHPSLDITDRVVEEMNRQP